MKRGLIAVLLVLLAGCSATPGVGHGPGGTRQVEDFYKSAVRMGRLTPPFTQVSEKVTKSLVAEFFGETSTYVLSSGTRLNEPGTAACQQRYKAGPQKPVAEARGKLVLLCSHDMQEAAVFKLDADGTPDVHSVSSVTLQGATMYMNADGVFFSAVKSGDGYRTTKPGDDTAEVEELDNQLLTTWRTAMANFYGQSLTG